MRPSVLCALFLASVITAGAALAEDRVFELCTYTTEEGKLDELHQRFENHTIKLFEKHGMDVIGFWVPDGEKSENTLVYLLAYPSAQARAEAWQAFIRDPEWTKAFEESRKNGALVKKVDSQMMSPAQYSAMK